MAGCRGPATTRSRRASAVIAIAMAASVFAIGGCHVDSYLDPSRTGYFEHQPSTVPILTKLDVIERNALDWGETERPSREDLVPTDLTYRLHPGDTLGIELHDLIRQDLVDIAERRVDQGGYIRVPQVGDVYVAGMTAQQTEDHIEDLLREQIVNPIVNVTILDGRGFQFSISGGSPGTGLYALLRPDFRISDAIALSGGVPLTTKKIYVIRQVPLFDEVEPDWDRMAPPPPRNTVPRPDRPSTDPIDIDSLIDALEENGSTSGGTGSMPGVLRYDGEPPLVDIDDLEPVRVADTPADLPATPTVPAAPEATPGAFVFVPERNEWVKRIGEDTIDVDELDTTSSEERERLFLERVIEIDYPRLVRGDSSYNIVIRPGDRIYVDLPPAGVVYIDGEIIRPGVYRLPIEDPLTLSRLVAAAGGLGPIAIPERVDLVRIVGEDREAAVRVNLAAIRARTEPDIYLKANDHIIIGTNFWATPLAVIRNGFRATYGFGFVLDRNFGNDVFGAPPSNNNN